jgi:hypothetical protein
MSAPDPVGISSQGAQVEFRDDETQSEMARIINDTLTLFRDDIQRLAALAQNEATVWGSSGSHKWVATGNGVVQAWAVSDTATSSTGANYHTLTLYRNGAAANAQTYRTDRAEVPAYQGGAYLGEATVAIGDVLSLNLAVTGAPAPTLTTANFSLLCKLREK